MRLSNTLKIIGSFALVTLFLFTPISPAKAGKALEGAVIGASVGSLACGKNCAKKGAAMGAIAGM